MSSSKSRGLFVFLMLCLGAAASFPYLGQSSDTGSACFDVPEYQGINAIPAVTMQIYPSAEGDTVVNDADAPPGEGELVVVGFWEHSEDYSPQSADNPCAGEPTLKIAFPVEYGSRQCFGWKNWREGRRGLERHDRSAKGFSCRDGVLEYREWPTLTCEAKEGVEPKGTRKNAAITQCCRDPSSTTYSQILRGCGNPPKKGTPIDH